MKPYNFLKKDDDYSTELKARFQQAIIDATSYEKYLERKKSYDLVHIDTNMFEKDDRS